MNKLIERMQDIAMRGLWCVIAHRRKWSFYGYGDWRIQVCEKCGAKWVVPSYLAKGYRIPDPSERNLTQETPDDVH